MGFIQTAAAVLPFFKSGPGAWNGLLPWYIPFIDFFAWFLIITVLTIKAINKPGYEAAADAEIVQHSEVVVAEHAQM